MNRKQEVLLDVVIKFAGDSGDGMQLTGTQFTNNTALLGADLSTFPIFRPRYGPTGHPPRREWLPTAFFQRGNSYSRRPMGCAGGYECSGLKNKLKGLKKGGKIIVNTDGFDTKNLRLANYPDGVNPIENNSLEGYEVIKIDVTKMTREALKDFQMGTKEKDRAKNMFVLGFLYWMYGRDMGNTETFLQEKFSKKPDILDSNLRCFGPATTTAIPPKHLRRSTK
jgi:2-oxoglutarate ferredoxin oxidoreductase subunit alpha